MSKKLIRKNMKELLDQLSQTQILDESTQVFQKILLSKILDKAQFISIYVSTHGEIITDPLIEYCLSLKKNVYIPQFKKEWKNMEMIRLNSLSEFKSLKTNLWEIRQHSNEPNITLLNEDLLNYPEQKNKGLDLIIMPGVAFTLDGCRCGHGKGYYDNFLNNHNKYFGRMPIKIGLSLKAQILKSIPMIEGHDVYLDKILHSDPNN